MIRTTSFEVSRKLKEAKLSFEKPAFWTLRHGTWEVKEWSEIGYGEEEIVVAPSLSELLEHERARELLIEIVIASSGGLFVGSIKNNLKHFPDMQTAIDFIGTLIAENK